MNKEKAVISLDKITTGYRSGKTKRIVSENVNLDAEKGKLIFLIGPNGSGKTTLLKTITGDLKPLEGMLTISGEEISSLKINHLSRLISVVLTTIPDPGYLTVEEIISLGRSPYTGLNNSLSDYDKSVIQNSVITLDLDHLKNRLFSRLSDGEKQKTMIARALCQDTEIICMDEPSSHLDFPSRLELVSFLKKIAEKENKTIIVSSHDLNLAINSSDEMWLIDHSGNIDAGAAEDLALSGSVARVFNRQNFRFSRDKGEFIIDRDFRASIHIKGDPLPVFWTERGLGKLGIENRSNLSDTDDERSVEIIIEENTGTYTWQYNNCSFKTIKSLIEYIKNLKST